MIVSSFCASLTMAIIIFIPTPKSYAFLLSFFLGFSISSYVLPYAVVGEIIPDKARGKAMGFINCITLLFGAPLLQPLIGSLLKNPRRPILENFRPALILLFITLFLAFILSFCIKETYCLNKVSKKS
jgi:sugar phosphate permease